MPTPLSRHVPLVWIIAWRYLRGQRSQLLSGTATAALFATSLGVMAMVIAMALMSGYSRDLQRKLIGLQGEIVASPLGQVDFEELGDQLRLAAAVEGVRRVSRVAYGEGSLSSPDLPEGLGVVLRGVEQGNDPLVQRVADSMASAAKDPELANGDRASTAVSPILAADERGLPGVLLGKELRRQLGVEVGEVLRLVVLEIGDRRPKFHYRSVRVSGTFAVGFAEFDARWVLIDRQLLESIRGTTGLDVVELALSDPEATDRVAEEIEAILGSQWIVQRWLSLNKELFAALALQELLLFLVLGLIVVVSTFNVASTLVILVRERMADIGVLGALGLPPGQLWRIFVAYGLGLGAVGIFLGVVAGTGVAWVFTEFELIRFPPEVAQIYFIDSVPFRVEGADILAIVVFSFTVTLLACSLPARRASRLRPAVALRAE